MYKQNKSRNHSESDRNSKRSPANDNLGNLKDHAQNHFGVNESQGDDILLMIQAPPKSRIDVPKD